MGTAAPGKQPAATGNSGFNVSRSLGVCAICSQPIAVGEKFTAALVETPTGFTRSDFMLACWPQFDRKDVVGFWQTTMPKTEEKKKVFVDDEVLCDLFARLGDVQEPAKVNFRFVLGLILMRKRLVVYESSEKGNGRDLWKVRLKGKDEILDLVDPKLGEEQVKEVSGLLGEILSQEL